ncbi:acyl-CoA dehydrogenase family protein [Rhodococcus sp. BP-349]|uniref:acyl-CoA dehydrogenase family protein n=1 Tax=unclassified Rhodococcus (in: high G+C Gram-positive bacteria) TaxID=192944 RepID=UPI001C9A815E|nr:MULTISPECIES: acyl-CoA dehydrogenase family protein [unclassified Rhodococcus (in: high G+C Gram-positive bacteria)]MBY6538826.1 acyl-CoA dehydrogenase family protein [Rhodococcus sp. BP-363]MBY6543163.1 acyl-CoA dehydrogenase family protein [Rhodococcus sp. BP-369]MBY6562393.1 acyl-CoA dehydrogenase family protein [Rhodococcus sp. BP-370]MBY6576685.1 acyl-CoA dehydrogenase family protein [Rhodococcus sp. BP-364]MBY6585986.1 acyl-CoA dehydrogenase family protein [Rhodococcus sp. BP-358]
MYFTRDQLDFAASVADFCTAEVGTREKRNGYSDNGTVIHSRKLFAKMARLGWAGIAIPEEYGGSGGGLVEQCLFFEETSRALAPVAAAASTQLVAQTILKYASEEQKQQRIPMLVDGASMSLSLSEPEAGSDAANVACKAVRDGDNFVINGQKTWASYAHLVDRILLVVRTSRDADAKHKGLTMLDVDPTTEGMTVHEIPTMGSREVNDIYLTDVSVPASAVVGIEGGAWRQVMSGLNSDRLIIAAQAVGNARRALQDATEFLGQRRQFGSTLSSMQALRHQIADLATEVEAARALTFLAAHRVQERVGNDKELTRLTSMAKLKATETARKVALDGIQLLGGYGFTKEFDMEHIARHTIAAAIYGGTSQIQREIVARTLM